MKQLIDFLPILLFFAAYKLGDIYIATGVLMGATVLQMAYVYRTEGTLSAVHKMTLILVLFFGTLTLWLQDERFIKWKPTFFYAVLGLAILITWWGFGKNALQALLGKHLQLTNVVWNKLNNAWVLYAFFMAALNAYVAYYYSTETWVNFKLWGYVFPLLFLLGQGIYVAKHLRNEAGEQ